VVGGGGAAIQQALQVAGASGSDIEAVGLTGRCTAWCCSTRPGRAPAGDPLERPAHGRECDLIRRLVGRERLIRITGNDALTGFTARRSSGYATTSRRPGVGSPTSCSQGLRAVPAHWRFAVDKADGSGTILFDLAARTGRRMSLMRSRSIAAGCRRRSRAGGHRRHHRCRCAGHGLRAGTPVVAGGGDQAANASVSGRSTRESSRSPSGHRRRVRGHGNARIRPGRPRPRVLHAVPDRWHMMSVMLSRRAACDGSAMRWRRMSLRRPRCCGRRDPAGSDGLLFLRISPASAAAPRPLARGAFVGLTVDHDRRHMTRAVLEGVAFGLRDGWT